MTAADPYADLAMPFVDHYSTLRGVLRFALVARQLDEHLPRRHGLAIADVGGGDGRQAIRLARLGHDVTIIDPSHEMLSRAEEAIGEEAVGVRARVEVVEAYAADASRAVAGRGFDVVLCHAVLPYVSDPRRLFDALGRLAKPEARATKTSRAAMLAHHTGRV